MQTWDPLKNDRMTKLICVVVCCAIAAYFLAAFLQSLSRQVETEEVVRTVSNESIQVNGIVIRSELVLDTDRPYLSVTATSGEEVAAGSQIALAVDSQEELDRMSEMQQIQTEIDNLEEYVSSSRTTNADSGSTNRTQTVIRQMTGAVARGETLKAEEAASTLESLLLGTSTKEEAETKITELTAQLNSLQEGSGNTGSAVTAPAAGFFTTELDGYEYLTPDRLANITTADLRELLEAQPQTDDQAYGKIVTEFTWYFAALLEETDAARLAEGDSTELEFNRYYTGTISARVENISAAENGQCAVVFSLKDALSETISMRTSSAEIVFSTVEGLQVPLKALHVTEDGKTVVYCLTSGRVEQKEVNILLQQEDYAILEEQEDPDSLREGDKVITRGYNLEDGKVIES
jgi:putative membrane fusion protein